MSHTQNGKQRTSGHIDMFNLELAPSVYMCLYLFMGGRIWIWVRRLPTRSFVCTSCQHLHSQSTCFFFIVFVIKIQAIHKICINSSSIFILPLATRCLSVHRALSASFATIRHMTDGNVSYQKSQNFTGGSSMPIESRTVYWSFFVFHSVKESILDNSDAVFSTSNMLLCYKLCWKDQQG